MRSLHLAEVNSRKRLPKKRQHVQLQLKNGRQIIVRVLSHWRDRFVYGEIVRTDYEVVFLLGSIIRFEPKNVMKCRKTLVSDNGWMGK
jgi:hypothetical protein